MSTQLSLSDITSILHARQYAYDILRRFFIEEPSKEYVRAFIQKNMINVFPFKEEGKLIDEGIKDIQLYLSTNDPIHIERHFDELHWDYTRMFIGPEVPPAPPWESSYVRKDKLLFQSTTMNVRKIYEKYGMAVTDFNIEPDDHIGLELDFMYNLNELCLSEIEKGQFGHVRTLIHESQHFLTNHLLKFTKEFSELVQGEANTKFYVGLAKILHPFLEMDSLVLKELSNIDFTKRGNETCLI